MGLHDDGHGRCAGADVPCGAADRPARRRGERGGREDGVRGVWDGEGAEGLRDARAPFFLPIRRVVIQFSHDDLTGDSVIGLDAGVQAARKARPGSRSGTAAAVGWPM
ncbi:MAG TPA: hypothetical protein ENN99_01255 [Chloroflexi bacterium]|nr:hypothetical protein [Chloroflexota bacterium]